MTGIELPRIPSLTEWIELLGGLYGQWGYLIVPVAAAIENTLFVTFFFPGGTMVILGGVYARLGQLELPLVILLGWLGTFAGASLDYAIGRWGYSGPLGRLLRSEVVAQPLEKAGEMFLKYGFLALMAGHFVGQIRSLVAVAAGVTRMPYWRFALYEAPAALAWSAAYAIGGYALADQLPLFEQVMQRFGWAVGLAVGLFFAWKLSRTPRRVEPPA